MNSTSTQPVASEVESDATQASRKQFDAQAQKYAVSPVHKFGASLAALLELAAPTPADEVLDVATGTGNTAFYLAPHVKSVIGVDVAPKMLEQAQRQAEENSVGNVSFSEGNAEELPFESGSFSLVAARMAPHHFRGVPAFLSEVRRVLKPGGRFLLADEITPDEGMLEWVDFWQRRRDPSHFAQRTVAQWHEVANAAGLKPVAERIIPYRLDFEWWTRQSGCTPETIEILSEHARQASPEIKKAMGLEFDENGQVTAQHLPILVARFDRVD